MRHVHGYQTTIEGEGIVEWIYGEKLIYENIRHQYKIDDGDWEHIEIGSNSGKYGATGYIFPVGLEFKKKIQIHNWSTIFYRLKE